MIKEQNREESVSINSSIGEAGHPIEIDVVYDEEYKSEEEKEEDK